MDSISLIFSLILFNKFSLFVVLRVSWPNSPAFRLLYVFTISDSSNINLKTNLKNVGLTLNNPLIL